MKPLYLLLACLLLISLIFSGCEVIGLAGSAWSCYECNESCCEEDEDDDGDDEEEDEFAVEEPIQSNPVPIAEETPCETHSTKIDGTLKQEGHLTKYGYYLLNCEEDVTYTIEIKGTTTEQIEPLGEGSGTLKQGVELTGSGSRNTTLGFTEICVNAGSAGSQCFSE